MTSKLLTTHGLSSDEVSGILILDTETDINLAENDPSPHVVGTKPVLIGCRHCILAAKSIVWLGTYTTSNCSGVNKWLAEEPSAQSRVLVVGHNISFDMLHLMHAEPAMAPHVLKNLASGTIVLHDTQDVEYVLTGHETKWASLDGLAETHGVEGKKDTLKEHLATGANVSDMDPKALEDYLVQDIKTTQAVAEEQLERCSNDDRQIQLASMRRAVTTIMMYNGMPFDVQAAQEAAVEYEDKANAAKVKAVAAFADLVRVIASSMSADYYSEVLDLSRKSVSSNKALMTMLAGGTTRVSETQILGTYKNGKPKTKKVSVDVPIPSALALAGLASPTSVDENALTGLLTALHSLPATQLRLVLKNAIAAVLEYRTATKILGTYIEPLLHMYTLSKTGNIHPSLNTCATATGRLSSSKPNAQNMPSSSPVKSFFKRAGWTCVEGDYKQLEMIALAVKSCDKQLLEDLAAGVDIHYEVGKTVMGWTNPSDMTKETRRLVKSVDFGLVYGGGAKTLAAQSGAEVTVVQSVIDAFFKRYSGVLAYHKRMEGIGKDVMCSSPTGKVLENGALERRKSLVCGITGRTYSFLSYPNRYGRDKSGSSFSPTELKNYLVQGLATADFVPFACAVLAMAMAAAGWMDPESDGEPKAKLCNTVHDSIVVWVKDEYAHEFAQFMKDAMEVAWPMMFDFFGQPQRKRLGTQVVAEISMGPSWGETVEVKL